MATCKHCGIVPVANPDETKYCVGCTVDILAWLFEADTDLPTDEEVEAMCEQFQADQGIY